MSRFTTLFTMLGGALILLALLLHTASAAPAAAPGATITVTTNVDQTSPVATGSLRWAIQQANTTTAADIIAFNIPANQNKVILLVRELPEITTPMTIDGTTQNPSSTTPPVELNGAGAIQGSGEVTGLTIRSGASGTTVRGLAINSFRGNGIQILDSNNNTIEKNFIGTDMAGTTAFPNGKEGILVGNETLTANNNVIKDNLISGNTGSGVHLSGLDTNNNVIKSNKIGTDVTGTEALPNEVYGVRLENSPNNTVGGTGANAGNIIAFNGESGILVEFRDGNTIRRNSIFSNGGLGIEVSGFSPENAPLISPVGSPPTNNTTVSFTGDPNTQYTFEFFNNDECDPSDYGEGQDYLLTQTATTNGSGLASFNVAVQGPNVTATATGGIGTSLNPLFTTPFSPCYTGTTFATNTPTPTATSTATGTPTSTRTQTLTSTPVTNTLTPTPTSQITETPGSTDTPTATPTNTRTSTATRTATSSPSPTTPGTGPTNTPTATPCPGGKPSIPTNVSPGNSSSVFVRAVPLAWVQPCAAFYKVMIKEGSKSGPKAQKKKVTVQQFTTKQLDKGKNYFWHVKACKPGKKNCSKWSAWWSFKISNSATYNYQRDDWFVTQVATDDTALLTK